MDKIQKYPKTTSAQVRVDSEGNTLEYALAAINSAINGKATPDELELVKNTLESEIAAKASTTDVIDNELTQAAALAEMSKRIDDIEVPEGGGGMTETTYADLKALRDAGTLTPGMWYRITDYQCTTSQAGTTSAGNQFDIIVRADSTSILNENAYAALHEGDTYFASCKLQAWKLKYTIDNNKTRFSWADSKNGKGVIYWMQDEWSNECSYDFKNIQFYRSYNEDTGLFSTINSSAKGVACYTFSNAITSSATSTTDNSLSGNVLGNIVSLYTGNFYEPE